MQIIFPVVNNTDQKMVLANGLNTTNCICLYNNETDNLEWVDVTTLKSQDGNLANDLQNRGVRTIVTPQISLMALTLFLDNGFDVYRAESSDIQRNIELLANNKLNYFSILSATKKNCSVGCCKSCETSCLNENHQQIP